MTSDIVGEGRAHLGMDQLAKVEHGLFQGSHISGFLNTLRNAFNGLQPAYRCLKFLFLEVHCANPARPIDYFTSSSED